MRDLLSVREQGPGPLPLHYNRLLCSRLRSRETAGAGDTMGTLPAPHVRRGRGGGVMSGGAAALGNRLAAI